MPRFSSTGLRAASGALQQREILHVARADLDHVGVLLDQVERFVVDRLGDDLHAKLLADVGHDAETVFAQPLKRVGRGAGLVGAAAEKLRPGATDALGHGKCLFAALDGARPGDNGQSRTTDRGCRSRKADDRVVFLDVAADQFVGLRDLDDFLHARHFFERALFDFSLVAGDADGGAGGARHGVGAVAQLLDFLADIAHLLIGGVRLHDD